MDREGSAGSGTEDGDAFDRERLSVLVGYSAALRWQMLSSMLVIAALAWLGGVDAAHVATWAVLTIAVREARAVALLRLDRRDRRAIAARLRETTAWTVALGLAYGSSSLFMLGMDTAYDAVLTMILMSLSAGAVSTTFTLTPAFVGFAASIALPAALQWLASGSAMGVGVAALIAMFLGVQVRFSRQNLQMFADSYRMRLENAALLRQLTDERARLAQARDAAVAADLSKSRFLAAASHDLRQPLQSLSLNSGVLARMPMPADAREVAGEIGVGIEALRRMLDALLDISQLDAGAVRPELRAIPVERLLDSVAGRFRPTAAAKGLQLRWHAPTGLVVTSDVQLLQRVLSNLVDNAIKFTAEGGITLAAVAAGPRVRLVVADTGRGIAPADRQRVFEDLVQLDNPQRDRAFGHGLGLGIVRRLCVLLGIELAVESAPGAGTTFRLDVPAGEALQPPAAESPAAFPGLVARRVLVLDDDAAVRTAYARSLRALGCEVDDAATLGRALELAAASPPEVALVDYRLPGNVNGLDAVARLRGATPGLTAIIVSADTSAALLDEAARQGVPMLRKPVTEAMLAAAINGALAASAAAQRRTADEVRG
jgi:signal transduction histidine kinase/ActR/RegA family two-component response regulator